MERSGLKIGSRSFEDGFREPKFRSSEGCWTLMLSLDLLTPSKNAGGLLGRRSCFNVSPGSRTLRSERSSRFSRETGSLARVRHSRCEKKSVLTLVLTVTVLTVSFSLQGDSAARSNDPFKALMYYVSSLVFDRSSFLASRNSAAVRLQLANDSDRQHQFVAFPRVLVTQRSLADFVSTLSWSRAIYDSTSAIFYGPPHFKAYYRRGYALAHLKMYKKAIVGKSRLRIASFIVRSVALSWIVGLILRRS